MLFTTTQQQEEIRKKVREFAETEIKPIAFMLDKENEFPSEAIAKFGKMGLMGIPYPCLLYTSLALFTELSIKVQQLILIMIQYTGMFFFHIPPLSPFYFYSI